MKASDAIWKERFKGKLPEPIGSEVDQFETEIELRKQGKIDEKVFAETRLRRGAYGQRYDNGQRYDGTESRKLPFADKPTRGPGTMWDAPGMLRITIPGGGLNPRQLEVMAELAEEYSDGIAHVTTRQFPAAFHPHRERPVPWSGSQRSASLPARRAAMPCAM